MIVNFDDLILGKPIAIAKPNGIHDRIWEKMLPILQRSFGASKKVLKDLKHFKRMYNIPEFTYTNQELIDMLALEWIMVAFQHIYAEVLLKAEFANRLKQLPSLRDQAECLQLSDDFPANLFGAGLASDRPLTPEELKAFVKSLLEEK